MRFSDTFLDEIRQRLPITQVVGEYVQWDKRKSQPGRGDMWACCPFHGEKTPSFHADDRKGIYHCFGCGATGDHFRFLTEKGGLSFPEAVERLANLAGVQMPARDERTERQAEVRRTLYDVLELAAAYFEAALSHNIGARARGYLNERQVSAKAQARFRVGFAPDSRNGLKEHLAVNGVSAADMIAAGLLVTRDDVAVPYDRFRNRLMFPILDLRGRVIAFGGRALSADVPAKYLNSPETDLFSKRRVLYNGQAARQAAHDGKPVVVVEGYLDVIAAVEAGFEGAVAPLGTALTEDHLALIWQWTDEPVICFDGDAAGQRAADRSADMILPLLTPGKTARFAHLPEGLDPDDLIKQQGRQAFADLVGAATPLSEAVWGMETRGVLPETPEARAALEARLKARANGIADGSVRRHYLQAFDERLRAFLAPVRQRGSSVWQERRGGAGARARGTSSLRSGPVLASAALRNSRLMRPGQGNEIAPRETAIVMSLVNHPALADARIEQLAGLDFTGPQTKAVLGAALDIIGADPQVDGPGLRAALGARGFGEVLARLDALLRAQGIWQAGPDSAQSDAETGLKHALALHYKSVQLNKELKAAERALELEWSEDSFERLQDIKNQLSSVDGTEALIEGFGSLSGRTTRSF